VTKALGHAQAFELLPWLVNGTLSGEERELVDRHVATCLVCRAELKSQSALRTFVENQPTVSWSAESGYERLARQLDVAKTTGSKERAMPASALRGATRLFRGPARIAGIASIAAALAVAAWLGVDGGGTRGTAGFTTLTETAESSSLLVDIVFAESVTGAEQRALLDELGATVAAGPSEVGRLTIRLSADAPQRDRDAVIATLQNDPRVRFAARNFTLEQSGRSP
jgi:anti-sigma factor RsiW